MEVLLIYIENKVVVYIKCTSIDPLVDAFNLICEVVVFATYIMQAKIYRYISCRQITAMECQINYWNTLLRQHQSLCTHFYFIDRIKRNISYVIIFSWENCQMGGNKRMYVSATQITVVSNQQQQKKSLFFVSTVFF